MAVTAAATAPPLVAATACHQVSPLASFTPLLDWRLAPACSRLLGADLPRPDVAYVHMLPGDAATPRCQSWTSEVSSACDSTAGMLAAAQ
jgi:hypothetical protein